MLFLRSIILIIAGFVIATPLVVLAQDEIDVIQAVGEAASNVGIVGLSVAGVYFLWRELQKKGQALEDTLKEQLLSERERLDKALSHTDRVMDVILAAVQEADPDELAAVAAGELGVRARGEMAAFGSPQAGAQAPVFQPQQPSEKGQRSDETD